MIQLLSLQMSHSVHPHCSCASAGPWPPYIRTSSTSKAFLLLAWSGGLKAWRKRRSKTPQQSWARTAPGWHWASTRIQQTSGCKSTHPGQTRLCLKGFKLRTDGTVSGNQMCLLSIAKNFHCNRLNRLETTSGALRRCTAFTVHDSKTDNRRQGTKYSWSKAIGAASPFLRCLLDVLMYLMQVWLPLT